MSFFSKALPQEIGKRDVDDTLPLGGIHVGRHGDEILRAGVSLTWKFGGYTEKKREAVDTERFK